MTSFLVTLVQRIDVEDSEDSEAAVNLDDFHDSFMDHCLDEQDSEHETSDTKFTFVPREIRTLNIEPVE
jgi:hypothetical protein